MLLRMQLAAEEAEATAMNGGKEDNAEDGEEGEQKLEGKDTEEDDSEFAEMEEVDKKALKRQAKCTADMIKMKVKPVRYNFIMPVKFILFTYLKKKFSWKNDYNKEYVNHNR